MWLGHPHYGRATALGKKRGKKAKKKKKPPVNEVCTELGISAWMVIMNGCKL